MLQVSHASISRRESKTNRNASRSHRTRNPFKACCSMVQAVKYCNQKGNNSHRDPPSSISSFVRWYKLLLVFGRGLMVDSCSSMVQLLHGVPFSHRSQISDCLSKRHIQQLRKVLCATHTRSANNSPTSIEGFDKQRLINR